MHKNKSIFKGNGAVTLLRPTVSAWGSFGLVQATLDALSIVKNHGDFDRAILLSGLDYPIKSNTVIDDFFSASRYSNFMQSFKLPNYNKWHIGGGSYRIHKYYFGSSFITKYLAKSMNLLSSWFDVFKRRLTPVLQHFHGSQWWILDMRAIDHILEFVDHYPSYKLFHRYTFAPDEIFFQTILLNTDDELLKRSILNNNKRFMKWHRNDSAHPQTLTINDINDMRNSTDLFARKFDGDTDSMVLDMIDRDCLNNIG